MLGGGPVPSLYRSFCPQVFNVEKLPFLPLRQPSQIFPSPSLFSCRAVSCLFFSSSDWQCTLWSDHREQELVRVLNEDEEHFKQKIIHRMLRLLWEQMGYRKMGSGTLIHDLTVQLWLCQSNVSVTSHCPLILLASYISYESRLQWVASRDSVSSQAFSMVCSLVSNMQVAHADKNQMHLFLDHDPLHRCRFIEPKKKGLKGMYQLSWVISLPEIFLV